MALTRVAPAGIGSTPGTGYVIGDSFLHSRGLNATDGYYTGIVTTQSLRVIGDLEVEGTTTTLDTALTEVDKLEVGANNNTVGVAITQSGTGDILSLYDGSTQVVTVKDGGRVGVGTDSPQRKLSIKDSGNTFISIENSTNITSGLIGANSSGLTLISRDTQGGSTEKPIQFITGSTEKVRITSAGLVGIGTDNPDMTLHLYDSTAFAAFTNNGDTGESGILFRRHDNNHNRGKVTYNFTDDALIFRASNNGGGEDLRITSGGNVGIGITNPGSLLHISGVDANGARIKIEDNNNGFPASEIGVENGGRDLKIAAPQDIYFEDVDTGVRHLYIKSGGNVGIGENSPVVALHISRPLPIIRLQDSDNNDSTALQRVEGVHSGGITQWFVGQNSTSDTELWIQNVTNDDIRFGTNNTERLRIKSDGNVGVGDDNPSVPFNVKAGGASFAGQTTHAKIEDTTSLAANVGGLLAFEGVYNTNGDPACYAMIHGGKTNTDTGNYAGYLRFFTRPSGALPQERLRIDSDGNVGINQTSPNAPLSFNTGLGQKIELYNSGSGNEFGLGVQNSELRICSGSGSVITLRTGGYSGTERLRIQSNGILRLSTPGDIFDGTFFASQTINNTGSNTHSRIRFDRSNVAKFGLTLRSDDKFCISNLFKDGSVSADDSAFVMTNASNIGVGHANPDSKLHVYSSSNHAATFEYSSTSDCAIQVKNTQGSIFFGLGGNEGFGVATDSDLNGSNNRFMILQDGKTGINNVSPPVRLAIAESNDVKMLLSSSWGGTGQILFGGSSNSTGAANSTAAIIKCTSSAPGGQAVGQLQFIVNNGDDFDHDRLTIYPQGLGNAKTNGGPALSIRSGQSVSNPVASTAMRIRPQFYDADCGAGFAYFQMSPSNSDSTPTLVWRFGANVKMSGEITLTLCSRTNSPVNARFDRLTAKYRFAFYGEGDNDGSGLRHLTQIYKDNTGCDITSVNIDYVSNTHSQYGTNNDTWKDGYGYFKFNFSGLQGHTISCKIDLTHGLGYIHETYFE